WPPPRAEASVAAEELHAIEAVARALVPAVEQRCHALPFLPVRLAAQACGWSAAIAPPLPLAALGTIACSSLWTIGIDDVFDRGGLDAAELNAIAAGCRRVAAGESATTPPEQALA